MNKKLINGLVDSILNSNLERIKVNNKFIRVELERKYTIVSERKVIDELIIVNESREFTKVKLSLFYYRKDEGDAFINSEEYSLKTRTLDEIIETLKYRLDEFLNYKE